MLATRWLGKKQREIGRRREVLHNREELTGSESGSCGLEAQQVADRDCKVFFLGVYLDSTLTLFQGSLECFGPACEV